MDPPAPEVSPVVSKTEEMAQKTVNTVNAVNDFVKNAVSTQTSLIITIFIVGTAVAFFIAAVLYYMISTRGEFKKKSWLVKSTKIPVPAYQPITMDAKSTDDTVIPSEGNKGSISFWIYVNDYGILPSSGSVLYHVWHRGDIAPSPSDASPLVMIETSRDPATRVLSHKLHVSFSSNTPGSYDNKGVVTTLDKLKYMVAARGVTIDYIPMQRWVHVIVAVDSQTRTVRAYVDGQSVKSIDGTATIPIGTVTANRMMDDVNLMGKGNIHIGGGSGSPLGIGFKGLVSNIRFFNFSMDAKEAYEEYKRGPIDNLLAKAGLPAYGLRPPIYKMGEQ